MRKPTFDKTASMAMIAPPSAAARVFALPELLEHILLHLIEDGMTITEPPSLIDFEAHIHRFVHLELGFIKLPFQLLRTSRNFHTTVRDSKRIEDLCFAPVCTTYEHRPQVTWQHLALLDRVQWLAQACGQFEVEDPQRCSSPLSSLPPEAACAITFPDKLLSNSTSLLDDLDYPGASWRNHPAFPDGVTSVKVQLQRTRSRRYDITSCMNPRERLPRPLAIFEYDGDLTLGQLYDHLMKFESHPINRNMTLEDIKRYKESRRKD